MSRREFNPMVYAEIVHRATVGGVVVCEGCGFVLDKKPYHVDHTIPDGLFLDKKRKLTAEDGKLLGVECCHKPKTAVDVAAIAKAKRVEANHLGFERQKQPFPSRGFPKTEKSARQPKQPVPRQWSPYQPKEETR